MIEAATSNAWTSERKNSASKEEIKAASAKEESDIVLKFFNEISLTKGLKVLKKRELEP